MEYKNVTFIDRKTTYIDDTVIIGENTVIEPCVILRGSTVIGKNSQIGAFTEIRDSKIGDNVNINHSVIIESSIDDGTDVGPFAYIRPESKIGQNVKIGDFVEIKKSTVGEGTQISHLTYVGDAEVGKNINFGCGTVVCNYDGVEKHKTVIEDGAFIGCNTNLVAPVRIGAGAYTAAGSTITDDVPCDSLAVARARQVNKKNWKKK